MTPYRPRLADLTAAEYDACATDEAVQLLCLTALSHGNLTIGARKFVELSPDGVQTKALRQALDRGELLSKAIAPATTTDVANAGHLLPPAFLDPLTTRLQETSMLGKISQPVPVNVTVPYETAALTLKWVPESGNKPASQLAYASLTLGLFKFAGILVETRQLAEAPGSSRVIGSRLVNASARFLDQQLLSPTVAAVPGANPAAITSGVTPVTPGATIDDTISALVDAFYSARPLATAPMFVASPGIAMKIAGTKNTRGGEVTARSTNTLRGVPLVTTIGAGPNLILLDKDGIFSYDAGAELDVSPYASVEMEAAPSAPPTAATVTLSLWSHNCIGLRLDRFCSWMKTPNSVQYAVIA